jgi:hypothetical protein
LNTVALWSEDEIKKRERLIRQLQSDKGDLREDIYSRDKEIGRLECLISDKED